MKNKKLKIAADAIVTSAEQHRGLMLKNVSVAYHGWTDTQILAMTSQSDNKTDQSADEFTDELVKFGESLVKNLRMSGCNYRVSKPKVAFKHNEGAEVSLTFKTADATNTPLIMVTYNKFAGGSPSLSVKLLLVD